MNCSLAVNESDARGHRTDGEHSWRLLAECLELTIRQGDRDGQEDELFARLLAPLCFSGGRCCRQLERVHKLSPDIAGGVHVGKDDPDIGAGDQGIFVGCAVEETGDAGVWSWVIEFDAIDETVILFELKLGAVVTALRTSGFGVEIVPCEDVGFAVWSAQ